MVTPSNTNATTVESKKANAGVPEGRHTSCHPSITALKVGPAETPTRWQIDFNAINDFHKTPHAHERNRCCNRMWHASNSTPAWCVLKFLILVTDHFIFYWTCHLMGGQMILKWELQGNARLLHPTTSPPSTELTTT